MCRILYPGATVADVREARAATNASIGAAIVERGRVVILRHLTLDDAEAIAAHVAAFVLHFRSAGSRSRGPEWCQPFATRDGGALCAVGSRSAMRLALGLPADFRGSPVQVAADRWPESRSALAASAREWCYLPGPGAESQSATSGPEDSSPPGVLPMMGLP